MNKILLFQDTILLKEFYFYVIWISRLSGKLYKILSLLLSGNLRTFYELKVIWLCLEDVTKELFSESRRKIQTDILQKKWPRLSANDVITIQFFYVTSFNSTYKWLDLFRIIILFLNLCQSVIVIRRARILMTWKYCKNDK